MGRTINTLPYYESLNKGVEQHPEQLKFLFFNRIPPKLTMQFLVNLVSYIHASLWNF